MKRNPAELLSAARRKHFSIFLLKVFETLHPDLPPLELDWQIKAMCHALTEVHSGNVLRQIITVPPRHLKSIMSTVAFVAWTLGHNPSQQIIVAYYGLTLARHHCRLFRRVMESEWYRRDFPGTKIDSATALEFTTTAGGGRRAVSVDGALTGLGADLIIIDDAMKANDARSQVMCDTTRAWFDNTLASRINNKQTGKIISIQQRLGEADLTAYLLEKGFAELRLPAIAEKDEMIPIGNGQFHFRKTGDLLSPKRENAETLARMKREMGPVAFSAQYQQDPVVPEGNLIQMEWFGSYEDMPPRRHFLKVIQSWDTAASDQPTSDYSVCTTWGFEKESYKWYLLDVFRMRLRFPNLKKAVVRQHRQWKADCVIIEDASTGRSLFDELRVSREFRPIMARPVACKEERFNGALAEVEAGHFLLPSDAPWLEAFRSELRAFPYGRHDDQADSFSQFVNYQLGKWRYILTEFTSMGRPIRPIRLDKRPW